MLNGKVALIGGIVVLAALLLAFGPAPDQQGDDNTLRIMANAAPDSLDPAISWSSVSWTMQVNVYNGLLTFKKETGPAGTELVPDIAEAMPEITDGGRTLTFRMRRGVMFGPPANREVRPSDMKYVFDRLAQADSQGNGFFSVIEGFDEFNESGKGTVSGVEADDEAGTITFHLKRPDATFLYVLALPFTYVVPKGTAPEDLSLKTRTPATGPYQFTDYDPARRVVMERNPAFKEWTKDSPRGKVDRIVVELKVSDENAVTRIMQGTGDASLMAIPRGKLPFLLGSPDWKPYIHEHEISRISYIWMNTTAKPFDNVKVRQAVNWAINRRALIKLGGGNGKPTSQILPPTVPGHTEYEPYPKQDLAKARQLIADSGVTPGKVTIWCSTQNPAPDAAQYLQGVLTQLGFAARARCVDPSAYYELVGSEKNHTQIGFGSWGADYPEGATFIYSLLYGANINPDHSANLAFYSGQDERIDEVMEMLDLDERAKAWGELDRKIVEDGAWAPYSHGLQRNLMSKRVGDYVFHPLFDFLMMKATVDGSGTNNSKTHASESGYDAEGNPVEAKDGEGS